MKWNARSGTRMWVIMADTGQIIERDLRMDQAESLCGWHNAYVDMARAKLSHSTSPITLAARA